MAVERLEGRRLLAIEASVIGNVLTIVGDDGADSVLLTYKLRVEDGAATGLWRVLVEDLYDHTPDAVERFDAGTFGSIRVNLRGGSDEFDTAIDYVDEDNVTVGAPAGGFVADDVPQRPLTVYGGDGVDYLHGGVFRDALFGEGGDDVLQTGGNADTVDAGDGDDAVVVERVDVEATNGHPVVFDPSVVVSIIGGAGDDRIGGDEEQPDAPPMYVDAGVGNDTITGGAGRNRIYAGDGNDRLNGSGGRDFLYGEAGDDRIYGNAGNDYIDGGGGRYRAWAGEGDDSLIGGSSVDRLFGEAGNDTFVGGPGTDVNRSFDAGDVVDSVETTA